MKKNILKFVFFFVFFLFVFSYPAQSQTTSENEVMLEVIGWVVKNDKPLRRAEVLVWSEGELIEKHNVNRRGLFIILVDLGKKYVFEFTAKDHVPKKITFDAAVTKEKVDQEFYYFELEVELFEKGPGLDLGVLDTPFITVSFPDDGQAFDYNKDTLLLIASEIEQIKRRSLDLIDLRKDYDLAMVNAIQFSGSGELRSALDAYLLANSMFPTEELPQNRIEELTNELDLEETDPDLFAQVTKALNQQQHISRIVFEPAKKKDEQSTAQTRNEFAFIEDLIEEIDQENQEIVNEYVYADQDYTIIQENNYSSAITDYETVVLIEDHSVSKDQEVSIHNVSDSNASLSPDNKKTTVLFNSGSYSLSASEKSFLDSIASNAIRNGEKLILHSYSYQEGGDLREFYMSQRRAHAIVKHLHVSNEDIEVLPRYFGSSQKQHLASSESPRRVEIYSVTEEVFQRGMLSLRSESLTSFDAPGEPLYFDPGVEFSVQFMASNIPINPTRYRNITENLPWHYIYHYSDTDFTYRYLYGRFYNFESAMDARRQLSALGYDTYIVAFFNGERVSVSQALSK